MDEARRQGLFGKLRSVCGGMRERPMTEEEVERAHDTAANLPPARSFADGTETGWVDEYGRECG
jgi:hypothetical protein